MDCEHKHLRCTNNIFYCLNCGAVVQNPYVNDQPEGQKEKPVEAPKTGRKRKAVKADK